MLAISQSLLLPPHLKRKGSLTFADFKVVRSRDIKNPQLKFSRFVFPHLFELKYHSILTLLTTKEIFQNEIEKILFVLQTGIIAKKDLNVKSFIYTDHYNYPQPFFLYQNADFTFFF